MSSRKKRIVEFFRVLQVKKTKAEFVLLFCRKFGKHGFTKEAFQLYVDGLTSTGIISHPSCCNGEDPIFTTERREGTGYE